MNTAISDLHWPFTKSIDSMASVCECPIFSQIDPFPYFRRCCRWIWWHTYKHSFTAIYLVFRYDLRAENRKNQMMIALFLLFILDQHKTLFIFVRKDVFENDNLFIVVKSINCRCFRVSDKSIWNKVWKLSMFVKESKIRKQFNRFSTFYFNR